MADEPKVPEARDDDHEEVSDKLSIAAAMWARGDRADALSWVRRAAESASDLEQDMRALELAKAASELANVVDKPSAAIPAAAPAAAPARPPTAAPPRPPPTASPGRAPAAASTIPKKPPASRPPGGKLPPLPPLRPLGTAPANPPTKAPTGRLPSMVTSALGATTSSGTIDKDEPARDPAKPMPWDEPMRGDDEDEDEATHQIGIPDEPSPADMDATATREIAVMALQPAREEAPVSTREAEPIASTDYEAVASRDVAPVTRPLAELTLAVGVRVRLVHDAHGLHVYPEDERTDGVVAIVVPVSADDDLRALFQRRA